MEYLAMNFQNRLFLRCLLLVVCVVWPVKAVSLGPNGKRLNPRFTTVSSGSVIPDQSELDEVDEDTLKRGHEEITVDKDDEILTEIIEGDTPSRSLPLTTESKSVLFPSLKNTSKHDGLTNKTPQNSEPKIILKDKTGNFFNSSRKEFINTTYASSTKQGLNFSESSTENKNFLKYGNSFQTAQIAGNDSSNSQRHLHKSLPKILDEASELDSGGQTLENASQSLFHDEKTTTSQVELLGLDTQKLTPGKNLTSINRGILDLNPVMTGHNSNIANRTTSVGVNVIGNTVNASNLTDEQINYTNNITTMRPKSDKTSSNVMPADLTEVVDNASDIFKGTENTQNIAKKKNRLSNNNTDVVSFPVQEENQNTTKKSRSSNITDKVPQTNLSDTHQAELLNANDTKDLVSMDVATVQQNNSLPILGSALSEMKNKAIEKLDKKLHMLVSSKKDEDRAKDIHERQVERFGLSTDNGSQKLLPTTNFRRMTIIHHNTSSLTNEASAPHKQSKASHKLQSFLTAVKEMFNEPETAEDIMAWETWAPCSKTCGQEAVRTRQRRCGRLVQSGFDVACPEPRDESQKCPVVSCSAKSEQKPLQKSTQLGTKIENNSPPPVIADNDEQNVNQMFGKHLGKLRVHATNRAVDKFPGTEQNERPSEEENSDTSELNNDEQTEDGDTGTEGYDGPANRYDGTSEEDNSNNVASIQTANEKRYLYTVWGSWSACTRSCGQRAYAFRKRYCINAVSGEIKRHCQRPTILAKRCVLTACPVDGGLSGWSNWSSCSGSCGIMERHRSCTNPQPAYGGKECFKLPVQMRLCGTCSEDEVAAVQKLASYSPQSLCGFDPCRRVGCLEDKGAICVTDFECNPTFFDDEGKVLKGCKDSTQLFLRPLAQKKCSFNPCSFAKCDVDNAKCLVDTKCRPLFVDEMGKRVKCRGSNVLQISSELICGFNPCKITTCTVDPDAKCVTDYRCNPLFINAAGQKISGCTEDEVEEAERLTTERPTESQQSTENPVTENSVARDETPLHHFNPYLQHSVQKYREEHSVKKTIEENIRQTNDKLKSIKQLENILTERLHHSGTINSENITNTRNLEDIQRRTADGTRKPSKNLGKESLRTLDIKLLELILHHTLHPNKRLDSKSPIVSKKLKEFQDKKKDNAEKDFQNVLHVIGNGTSSKTFVKSPNKESEITVKTVHQSNDETREIANSPSIASEPLNSAKNNEISKIQEVADKPSPVSNKDHADPIEKPSQSKSTTDKIVETNPKVAQDETESNTSRLEQQKSLADVDRFILDQLYRKKMREDAGSASLGSSGVDHVEGKNALRGNELAGIMNNYQVANEFESKERVSGSYKNVDKNKNDTDISNTNKINLNDGKYNSSNKSDRVVSSSPSNMVPITGENTVKNNLRVAMDMEDEINEMDEISDNQLTTTTASNNHNSKNKNDRIISDSNFNNSNHNNNSNVNNNSNDKSNGNNNNNNNDDNNNNISKNSSNNLNFEEHKNQFDTSTNINLKTPAPPVAVSSTTQKPNNPSQNITQHYKAGLPKFDSIITEKKTASLDTKLGTQTNPQILKASDKTRGDSKHDHTLDILWRNYLADIKNLEGAHVSYQNAGKITSGRPPLDSNESHKYDYDPSDHKSDVKIKTGKVKVVDGTELVPGHKGLTVVGETGISVKEGGRTPVILSNDPNFQISPYDENVVSSAIEKEQTENPEGIPSSDELNRILNVASGAKPKWVKQDQYVDHMIPQATREEHKHPVVSSSQPLLQHKPVKQVIDNPSQNRNTDIINKLILKAVQKEISKLNVNEILKNSLNTLKNMKSKELKGFKDQSVKQSTQEYLGVTEKPIGDHEYKGLYWKQGEHGITGRLGVTERPKGHPGYREISLNQGEEDMNRPSPGIEKPRDDEGYKGVSVKLEEQDNPGHLWVTKKPIANQGYVGISKEHHMFNSKVQEHMGGKPFSSKPKKVDPVPVLSTLPIFRDEKESHSYHKQSEEADDTSNQETENFQETGHLLKNQHLDEEDEKTSPKLEQATITPAEKSKSKQMVEDPDYYTVTTSPMKGRNSDSNARITEVTEGYGDQTMGPEYKESYPPSLVDEIKELGLHEYFVKDGFQTPRATKHRKMESEQVGHILKARHWKAEEEVSNDFNYKHWDQPVKYGKKFHLAQVENLPDENRLSALRQHDSNGDEIERAPNSYRESDSVARSHTTRKKTDESVQSSKVKKNFDFPKKPGVSPKGSLTTYLDHLRRYIGNMDDDLLESGLKAQDKNEATQENLGNAIILTAKDDEDSQRDIEDSENPTDESNFLRSGKQNSKKNELIGNDALIEDDDEWNKNGLMVFRASDDEGVSEYKKRTLGNYRRTLGMGPKHPGFKTYKKPR